MKLQIQIMIMLILILGYESHAQNSDPVLKRVASAYYKRINEVTKKEIEQEERDAEAMRSETKPTPKTASSIVIDRKGSPIVKADVIVEMEATHEVIGRGTTDENGRFEVVLLHTVYRGLDLIITKKGYARWANGGIYGGIIDYYAPLDMEVDEGFLNAIIEQKDPEEKLWMLLELIGARQIQLEVERVYPHLGSLREDILRLIGSGLFDTNDDKHSSPAARARRFLEFWHDPADEGLFTSSPPQPDISGQTVQEVCKKWADHHFAHEKVENRTLNSFSEPIYGPERKNALIMFSVMYAHWGYSQRLVLRHDGQVWRLKMVQDYEHWDMK